MHILVAAELWQWELLCATPLSILSSSALVIHDVFVAGLVK